MALHKYLVIGKQLRGLAGSYASVLRRDFVLSSNPAWQTDQLPWRLHQPSHVCVESYTLAVVLSQICLVVVIFPRESGRG